MPHGSRARAAEDVNPVAIGLIEIGDDIRARRRVGRSETAARGRKRWSGHFRNADVGAGGSGWFLPKDDVVAERPVCDH